MVTINNRQRKIVIDEERLRADIEKILLFLDYADFDIGILITTNASMRRYNRDFRGKDTATDILSFPFYPELKAGQRIKARDAEEKNLGDIIISAEYVVAEDEKYQGTLEEKLRVLLVHGICHLLGYDHETDDDYRRMKAKEAMVLKKL